MNEYAAASVMVLGHGEGATTEQNERMMCAQFELLKLEARLRDDQLVSQTDELAKTLMLATLGDPSTDEEQATHHAGSLCDSIHARIGEVLWGRQR